MAAFFLKKEGALLALLRCGLQETQQAKSLASLRSFCEVAPLPAPNPAHPPTTLAVGRTASALNFIVALCFFKILSLILKFLAAKIVKFQLHYKSAPYFAKIPIKF